MRYDKEMQKELLERSIDSKDQMLAFSELHSNDKSTKKLKLDFKDEKGEQ